MSAEINESKTRQNFVWIKSKESNNTYVCPAEAVAGRDDLTEDELKEICVNESENPHND